MMNQLALPNCNTDGVAQEWAYGTYDIEENEMTNNNSSSNSTTEENSSTEYVPGTFEGIYTLILFILWSSSIP